MLVLSRRCSEEIVIGGNVHVTVVSVKGDRVRLGITAPKSVSVDRQEVHSRRFVTEVEPDQVSTIVGATQACCGKV